jgi:hypothetical protein
MYCFIYVVWFVFPVVINQLHRRWIIFKTFKSKTLSSLSIKASDLQEQDFLVCGWFLLELAKDQFLGVDPPRQHVPPCVWYGTTC